MLDFGVVYINVEVVFILSRFSYSISRKVRSKIVKLRTFLTIEQRNSNTYRGNLKSSTIFILKDNTLRVAIARRSIILAPYSS